MKHLVLTLCIALSVVLTGCTAVPSDASGSTAEEDTTDIEYIISKGNFPDEIGSLNVTFQSIFVNDEDNIASCIRETYKGPYKPMITPIRTPKSGDCYRTNTSTVDITEVGDNSSIGLFTTNDSYSAGHALIITDLSVTYNNGTTERAIKGIGGIRVNVERKIFEDKYIINMNLKRFSNRDYRYWLQVEIINQSTK